MKLIEVAGYRLFVLSELLLLAKRVSWSAGSAFEDVQDYIDGLRNTYSKSIVQYAPL